MYCALVTKMSDEISELKYEPVMRKAVSRDADQLIDKRA